MLRRSAPLYTLLVLATCAGRAPAQTTEDLPSRSVTIHRDIEYATVDGISLKLDLYLPNDAYTKPLVVWVHGGAWSKGSKNNPPVRWVTEYGYALASVDYRLTGVAPFPALVHDVKGAIRWLRANADLYGYDETRIGLTGGSAGGHLAALVGTTGDVEELEGTVGGNTEFSSRVQAIVDFYGPTDLVYNATVERERCDVPDAPLYQLLGGMPSERLDMARLASPVHHVTEDDPPIAIFHGTEDKSLVKLLQGHRLHNAYRSAGLESTYQIIEGAGHGGPEYSDAARRRIILDLFERNLRLVGPPSPFRWVNEMPANELPNVQHHTFKSPSMTVDVGYCIYLPQGYDEPRNATRRYPVVYYLHGGRPGSEAKTVSLSKYVHAAMSAGDVPPAIYVWVNGGELSHYNYPEAGSYGENVFIDELIPHVDATYRTIASREGRAVEGFSQGGRGTARIIFRHPDLFCSAAPGGGGHATEKSISENNGRENDDLVFAAGYNTYDTAREYAANPEPSVRILIFVGTAGFNYQNNLEYMEFLRSLGIPFEHLIVPDVPHSATLIYEKRGLDVMRFHAESFRRAAGG